MKIQEIHPDGTINEVPLTFDLVRGKQIIKKTQNKIILGIINSQAEHNKTASNIALMYLTGVIYIADRETYDKFASSL